MLVRNVKKKKSVACASGGKCKFRHCYVCLSVLVVWSTVGERLIRCFSQEQWSPSEMDSIWREGDEIGLGAGKSFLFLVSANHHQGLSISVAIKSSKRRLLMLRLHKGIAQRLITRFVSSKLKKSSNVKKKIWKNILKFHSNQLVQLTNSTQSFDIILVKLSADFSLQILRWFIH